MKKIILIGCLLIAVTPALAEPFAWEGRWHRENGKCDVTLTRKQVAFGSARFTVKSATKDGVIKIDRGPASQEQIEAGWGDVTAELKDNGTLEFVLAVSPYDWMLTRC